jgi:hypothetical protein
MTAKIALAPGAKINHPGAMVAATQALLQQHEANQQAMHSNERTAGRMISAMDSVASIDKDCTDDAIQSLLSMTRQSARVAPCWSHVPRGVQCGHAIGSLWLDQVDALFQAASAPMTRVDPLRPMHLPR